MNAATIVAITAARSGHGAHASQPIPPKTIISRQFYSTETPTGYVVADDLSMPFHVERSSGDIPVSIQVVIALGLAVLVAMTVRMLWS